MATYSRLKTVFIELYCKVCRTGYIYVCLSSLCVAEYPSMFYRSHRGHNTSAYSFLLKV